MGIDSKLKKYISQCLEKGMKQEVIINNLLAKGWSKEDVQKEITSILSTKQRQNYKIPTEEEAGFNQEQGKSLKKADIKGHEPEGSNTVYGKQSSTFAEEQKDIGKFTGSNNVSLSRSIKNVLYNREDTASLKIAKGLVEVICVLWLIIGVLVVISNIRWGIVVAIPMELFFLVLLIVINRNDKAGIIPIGILIVLIIAFLFIAFTLLFSVVSPEEPSSEEVLNSYLTLLNWEGVAGRAENFEKSLNYTDGFLKSYKQLYADSEKKNLPVYSQTAEACEEVSQMLIRLYGGDPITTCRWSSNFIRRVDIIEFSKLNETKDEAIFRVVFDDVMISKEFGDDVIDKVSTVYKLKKTDKGWKVIDYIENDTWLSESVGLVELKKEINAEDAKLVEDLNFIETESKPFKKYYEAIPQIGDAIVNVTQPVIGGKEIWVTLDFRNDLNKIAVLIYYYSSNQGATDRQIDAVRDAASIFRKVFPISDIIDTVEITIKEQYQDPEGHTKEIEFSDIAMNRQTYNKINWLEFDYADLNKITPVSFYNKPSNALAENFESIKDQLNEPSEVEYKMRAMFGLNRCGNGFEDVGETCTNCPQDVSCGELYCISGVCVECIKDSDCTNAERTTGEFFCSEDYRGVYEKMVVTPGICKNNKCEGVVSEEKKGKYTACKSEYCQNNHCGCEAGYAACERLGRCVKENLIELNGVCGCNFQCKSSYCKGGKCMDNLVISLKSTKSIIEIGDEADIIFSINNPLQGDITADFTLKFGSGSSISAVVGGQQCSGGQCKTASVIPANSQKDITLRLTGNEIGSIKLQGIIVYNRDDEQFELVQEEVLNIVASTKSNESKGFLTNKIIIILFISLSLTSLLVSCYLLYKNMKE